MSDPEEAHRRELQRSALAIDRPSGALIQHEYLQRRQEVVGVNRNDLEDILQFDGMEATFASFGLFLLSGAGWLGAEKLLEQTTFRWTPILAVCATSVFFGVISFAAALFMRHKKRGRIQRIFNETEPLANRR